MISGGLPIMKIKHLAHGAFLLITLLYGSYYAISKEALDRVDPIVFSFCVMMTLVPPALIILACSWRNISRQAVKSGFILGSWLCLGLFMLAVALRYNSATGTAFFPSLNGLLATLFTWLFLRQPITKTTWFAGIVSVTGAVLLMANAGMGGVRGSLIAFIGGLFCAMYIFLVDHEQKNQTAYWPLLAVELLTMALWGNLIALLFGDWNMVHFELPKDALIILYIGLGTICLPTVMTALLQKHVSPVTVSFISILEPLLGALVAYLYLHEVLPLDAYLGGGLIVAGVLIHTWGQTRVSSAPTSLQTETDLVPTSLPALRQGLELVRPLLTRFRTSGVALLLYPLLCSGIGLYIVLRLGGFPPPVWYDLFQSIPQFSTMVQQGQVMDVCIMVAQSLSWLIAWSSLLLMGGIATYSALEKLFVVVGKNKPNSYSETNLVKAIPTQAAQEAISRASYAQTQPYSLGPATSGLAADQSLQVDVRSLRQMGYTPYSASTRSVKRKLDPVRLQQHRLQRRMRSAHVESPKVTGPLPDTLPATIEKQYSDTHGDAYFYWDEFSQLGMGLAPSREKGLIPPFQKD
jgi:drug/metabolite transporter (DMT)-like permease